MHRQRYFVEGVDRPICHSLRKNCAMHHQTYVTNITFKARSLLAIQKGAIKPASTKNQATSSKQNGKRTWNNLSAHAIEIKSSASPTQTSQHRSRCPPVHVIHIPAASHSTSDTSSSSPMLPLLGASNCEFCCIPSLSTISGPVPPCDALALLAAIRNGNMKRATPQIETNTHLVPFYALTRTDVSITISCSSHHQTDT